MKSLCTIPDQEFILYFDCIIATSPMLFNAKKSIQISTVYINA